MCSCFRIVAVACELPGGTIASLAAPARHHHVIHALPEAYGLILPDQQGFLTSEGVYVSRKHAMIIAKLAGQVPMDHKPDELFSEDLW